MFIGGVCIVVNVNIWMWIIRKQLNEICERDLKRQTKTLQRKQRISFRNPGNPNESERPNRRWKFGQVPIKNRFFSCVVRWWWWWNHHNFSDVSFLFSLAIFLFFSCFFSLALELDPVQKSHGSTQWLMIRNVNDNGTTGFCLIINHLVQLLIIY